MPQHRQYDNETKAKILAYAALHGTPQAAKKYAVSGNLIESWLKSSRGDLVAIADIIHERREEFIEYWTDGISSALKDCVQFIREATHALPKDDPNSLSAIVNAVKVLAEAEMNKEVLSVWLENNRAPTGEVIEIVGGVPAALPERAAEREIRAAHAELAGILEDSISEV